MNATSHIRLAAGRERTTAIVASRASADEKLKAISAEADARSYLPPITMPETADGTRRFDQDTLRLMSRLFFNFGEVLNPFFAYLSMISPIIFFRASRPFVPQ